jgi:cytochrome c-type biogenesis protein CcmE
MIDKGKGSKQSWLKFLIGGGLILIAVIFMVISATRNTAEFFITVEELQASGDQYVGERLRVSGAVLGDSIYYDTGSNQLHFTIANIPDEETLNAQDNPDLILHEAVSNPESPRIDVVYDGAKPEMLKDEAQAILAGTLDESGVFIAEELLLKCPSKYEEVNE